MGCIERQRRPPFGRCHDGVGHLDSVWRMLGVEAEGFRALALKHRGRTGLSQAALARRAGVHVRSVQGWEGGLAYPSAPRLRPLIAALFEAGGFAVGHELTEAQALWEAVAREAPHFETPFDAAWFGELLLAAHGWTATPEQDVGPSSGPSSEHWGEAPDVASFLGRNAEREMLRRWVLDERCRVVAIVGLGGIGKTLLATRLALDLAPAFDYVYWRSLRNALAPGEWLAGAIRFLSPGDPPPPDSEAGRLERLLDLARRARCLLVLDNFETVLQPGERAGRFQPGFERFGTVVQQLAESAHQSCVLLTSREEPVEFSLLKGESKPVRVLGLSGLNVDDGQALLRDKQLSGDAEAWSALIARYGGNGLALKIVGESIRELFGGDIAGFLEARAGVFGGMRLLLDAQVQRLASVELEVLRWLAVEREPVSFADLAGDLGSSVGGGAALEAVDGLRRRSMLELSPRSRGVYEQGATFTLQSAVLEYMTEQVVDDVVKELAAGEPVRLLAQPLLKATAKDYVRRGQERLIAGPVLERLLADRGSQPAAERRLLTLLDQLRKRPLAQQGYAPGNLVNLLRLLRGDLRNVDLSGLLIRQAYLQEVEAQEARLVGADLAQSVLAEAFTVPNCVALSADGAYLAIGTTAGEVCLWRVADRQLMLSMQGHSSVVIGVAVSGDGRLLVSGSLDGTVNLWETSSGTLVASLDEHTHAGAGQAGPVHGVGLSADGRLVAIGSQDGSVRLWDTCSRRTVTVLQGHTGPAYGVALSADGKLVASGSYDANASFWHAQSGRLLPTGKAETGTVCGRAVAVSGDGRLLACGSLDGVVSVYEAGNGAVATLRGHTGVVYCTALSRDGRLLASGGQDGTLRLWDVPGRRLLATLRGHTGAVLGVALSGDGGLVASAGLDGTLRLWGARNGQSLATLQGHTGVIYGIGLCRDGRVLASGSQNETASLWEVSSGRLLARLQGHAGVVYGAALSGDARLVATCGQDETVRLWESASGRQLAVLRGHAGVVYGVALSADGRLLLSGSQDESARLWSAPDGRLLATLQRHTGGVWGVALSSDGRVAATGSLDGASRLWEAPAGGPLATLRGHTGGVWGVALSGDGQLVAGGSFDGTVKLWDASSSRLLATLDGHTGAVWGVSLSADGGLVASGGQDGTARLWDVATGRLLTTLYGPTGLGYGLALSGDGRLVASGSFDGTVKVWSTSSGLSVRTLQADRRYERMNITGLTGVTEAQRSSLIA
ncbi:MAG: hypothetical protein E6I75_01820, partial [Chloroflexi bacterium]